ncbi:TRAP transporter large permease subunit, partial [Mycobacterium tuberculosis]|nr:TRAP transporter large permease subunit [Mycobacterium tuberculosis]
VVGLIADLGGGPALFMLAANLLLLVAGCFLDIGAAILLLGPLLLPVATALGIGPVGFGVVVVVNLMIGGLTPPVGILI